MQHGIELISQFDYLSEGKIRNATACEVLRPSRETRFAAGHRLAFAAYCTPKPGLGRQPTSVR
jgi:hypothetical protein